MEVIGYVVFIIFSFYFLKILCSFLIRVRETYQHHRRVANVCDEVGKKKFWKQDKCPKYLNWPW